MTDTDPQYDASRVMFNGAAIGLVTNLTNGIRDSLTAEIKASEERQIKRLEEAVGALTGDVDDLENWRRTIDDARLLRTGQMSVFHAAGGFLLRYDKVILSLVIGAATAATLALFGVRLEVGP